MERRDFLLGAAGAAAALGLSGCGGREETPLLTFDVEAAPPGTPEAVDAITTASEAIE